MRAQLAAKEASAAKDVSSFVATAKADTKKSKHYKPKVFAYKPIVLARQRNKPAKGFLAGVPWKKAGRCVRSRPTCRRWSQLFLAFVWGTLALKMARKRRSIDKLDAEDACIASRRSVASCRRNCHRQEKGIRRSKAWSCERAVK